MSECNIYEQPDEIKVTYFASGMYLSFPTEIIAINVPLMSYFDCLFTFYAAAPIKIVPPFNFVHH